ncbi:MAG: hypothetical protein AB8B95_02140 [Pseudohongiellaceae bacterium]
MERTSRSIKPLAYGFVVFITLGISIANETLSRFGMENNYLVVFSVAFVFAACILASKIWLSLLVIAGVIAINLSDAVLLNMNLDRDVVLGAVCALILVPAVYELISS